MLEFTNLESNNNRNKRKRVKLLVFSDFNKVDGLQGNFIDFKIENLEGTFTTYKVGREFQCPFCKRDEKKKEITAKNFRDLSRHMVSCKELREKYLKKK